jgi:hypothetical protein
VRVLVLCRVLMGRIYVSGETMDQAVEDLHLNKVMPPCILDSSNSLISANHYAWYNLKVLMV